LSGGTFTWRGASIPFRQGESVATALWRAGRRDLGTDSTGAVLRYFCGIGACQGCLVSIDGAIVESCLTPARDGVAVDAAEADHG
jgi:aerobic-type carbon monoxide dehydrogenase small subunit (CoxS/CutS family)